MQRLAACLPTRAVAAYCATSCATRFGSDNGHSSGNETYVNKRAAKKLQDKDDDRWLEAEIDGSINTPEERYAHAREVDLLKKLVNQIQKEHQDKMDDMKEERDKEVESLKKQMESLDQRLQNLQQKK